MATIAEQLTSLANTKTAIKDAIVAKGVSVADTDTFASYPAKIAEISGGGAPATKLGVSIDNMIGDVDADGVYSKPTGVITLDLTGVKTVNYGGFLYRFYRSSSEISIIAPDLTSVLSEGFQQAFMGATKITARFDSLEEITSEAAFDGAFYGSSYTKPDRDIVFPRLKKINSNHCFRDCFDGVYVDLDKVFPVLEEIQGNVCFRGLQTGNTYTFSKVNKIVGGSSKYNGTFYMNYSGTVSINLPSATDVSGYLCYTSSSYKCNLHFAVANQAAIEACDGYSYKFGATEIYFDL